MKRAGKPNPGWFKKGVDERRHKLTYRDRRRGFLRTLKRFGNYHWLICKIRGSDPCRGRKR